MYKEIFNGEKNFDKISLAKVKLLVAMQRATDDGLKRRSNFVRCKVDSILKRNKRNIWKNIEKKKNLRLNIYLITFTILTQSVEDSAMITDN